MTGYSFKTIGVKRTGGSRTTIRWDVGDDGSAVTVQEAVLSAINATTTSMSNDNGAAAEDARVTGPAQMEVMENFGKLVAWPRNPDYKVIEAPQGAISTPPDADGKGKREFEKYASFCLQSDDPGKRDFVQWIRSTSMPCVELDDRIKHCELSKHGSLQQGDRSTRAVLLHSVKSSYLHQYRAIAYTERIAILVGEALQTANGETVNIVHSFHFSIDGGKFFFIHEKRLARQ